MAETKSLLTSTTTTPATTTTTTTTVTALVEERTHCPTQPKQTTHTPQHNRSVSSASTIHDIDVNKIEEQSEQSDADEEHEQESLPFLCHCQQLHRPAISTTSSMTSATATLRSTASNTLSACSCGATTATTMSSSQRLGFGHSCDQNLDCSTLSSTSISPSAASNISSLLRKHSKSQKKKKGISSSSSAPPSDDDDDQVLRYSFKGGPPEMYSAKKEFIYKRPLVEKQVSAK